MFFNKKHKSEAEEITTSNNIIGKGTIIQGNLESVANIRIEGKLIGDIKTKAKIAIGEGGVVNGNILANNMEVAGTINGNIEITGLLAIKATAVITGDIHASKIAMEAGARFDGKSKMSAVVREININENGESSAKKAA